VLVLGKQRHGMAAQHQQNWKAPPAVIRLSEN
jgi:hypothetical protein